MLNDAGPDLLDQLSARLGPKGLRAPGPDDLTEPRGLFQGRAAAVVCPDSTEQVAATLQLCNAARVGVVPMGGRTGLTGARTLVDGALPILLSLERLCKIRQINPDANTMIAEAGVVLQTVRDQADAAERMFPLSLASQGSAQVGGILSTNAGGVNVLRYGNARNLCLGVEAVLADGQIMHGLTGLHKDNTGYDLRHLLIGAEGTLGIITAAVLHLEPRPVQQVAAMIPIDAPATGLALLNIMRAALGDALVAFELIDRTGLDFLQETGLADRIPNPGARWQILADFAAGPGDDLPSRVENALEQAVDANLVQDAQISQNLTQRAAFWTLRENIPAANRRIGAISSHDIAVSLAALPGFITQARARIDPRFRINCFGHLGDGNLHFNIFPPKGGQKADYPGAAEQVRGQVYDLVMDMGGTFSAEHGIGRLKRDELARYGDPARLFAMRAIKAALDPIGILNPGALLV